jgi:hypothetical protein
MFNIKELSRKILPWHYDSFEWIIDGNSISCCLLSLQAYVFMYGYELVFSDKLPPGFEKCSAVVLHDLKKIIISLCDITVSKNRIYGKYNQIVYVLERICHEIAHIIQYQFLENVKLKCVELFPYWFEEYLRYERTADKLAKIVYVQYFGGLSESLNIHPSFNAYLSIENMLDLYERTRLSVTIVTDETLKVISDLKYCLKNNTPINIYLDF